MSQFLWLALMVLFLVVEWATVGLVSIWFAGGALIAMLLAAAGAGFIWQIIAFLAVSALLLVLTRPFAVKFINTKKEKTNYEGIIGKIVRVTERVDNYGQTGSANVGGQEWTARSEEDTVILEAGTLAKVVNIKGVKLILKPYEEE
ncbi:MAG: NfeD family protein [Lachnospiraceae bacterium]